MADGEKEMTDCGKEMTDGGKEMTDGGKEMTVGEKEMTDGGKEITDGGKEMTDGGKEMTDGGKEMTDGGKEMTNGGKEMRDGEKEMTDYGKEMTDGGKEMTDGGKNITDDVMEMSDDNEEIEMTSVDIFAGKRRKKDSAEKVTSTVVNHGQDEDYSCDECSDDSTDTCDPNFECTASEIEYVTSDDDFASTDHKIARRNDIEKDFIDHVSDSEMSDVIVNECYFSELDPELNTEIGTSERKTNENTEDTEDEGGTQIFGLLPKGQKKEGCKNTYDKQNYCTFCKKMIKSKISRHLLNVHKLEPRVSKICLLTKRSDERRIELEMLANEGNFKHNIKVLQDQEGMLVVGRRETTGRNIQPGDYLPCEYCRKFIMKHTLWWHHRTCTVRKFNEVKEPDVENDDDVENDQNLNTNNAVRRGRHLLHSALMEESDPFVKKMLDRMHNDEVKDVVAHDKLIRKYAALRVEDLGSESDQKINDIHRVSQCCRTLGRLILQCREINLTSMINIDSLISPEHFDLVVASTKLMSIDKENPAVSLGRYLGNILGHIIQVKIGDALRCGESDEGRCHKASGFQKLFEAEWNYRVNSVCVKRMNTLHGQKVQTIPLTEDLKTLTAFIICNMNQASTALREHPMACDWTKLAKLTMCRLILFNKRMRAEVKDLKVDD
ncbi:uncharacterized protein LOC110448181 [Mizuhopecten yessoensis]|uniref:uncharacterized protein LOC110448181 n=1 Tax=Mizuhopecten yessoensis TaxID=6573 RepID=UPI000B458FDD|nr:uncharacterized protein LOC110448181 [Mizuhopecten yessoensis]